MAIGQIVRAEREQTLITAGFYVPTVINPFVMLYRGGRQTAVLPSLYSMTVFLSWRIFIVEFYDSAYHGQVKHSELMTLWTTQEAVLGLLCHKFT